MQPESRSVVMPAYPDVARAAAPAAFRRAGRIALGRGQLLNLVEMLLEPLVLVASLWSAAVIVEGRLDVPHLILGLLVFSLTYPSDARLAHSPARVIGGILLEWLTLSALLLFFGWATRALAYFDAETLVMWWWAAPWCQIGAHYALRAAAPAVRELQGGTKRAVLAGLNPCGIELMRRFAGDLYSSVRVVGYVDDRGDVDRQQRADGLRALGTLEQLPQVVKSGRIDIVYLALPMASQPRIVALLDALRDTTASVYFVPDMFVTDLIQGRIDSVSGMPVVGVCDSPFSGLDGLIKRASDIVLSLLILALISPVLVLLALLVKLTSPGPVIFRQRRCGLDGEEIVVYKFRSMKVMENGPSIRQCARGDARLTPVGAFLRRSSLDELPQFFNVLQGRMSIVGPRPHACAHNDAYRSLIKGYMQRHKVRPGITGWAQIHGLRGETDTLDKMAARIELDLEYLRNWSLRLDLYIIAKTIWVVLGGRNAY